MTLAPQAASCCLARMILPVWACFCSYADLRFRAVGAFVEGTEVEYTSPVAAGKFGAGIAVTGQ